MGRVSWDYQSDNRYIQAICIILLSVVPFFIGFLYIHLDDHTVNLTICFVIGCLLCIIGICWYGQRSSVIFDQDEKVIYDSDTYCCNKYKRLTELGTFEDFLCAEYKSGEIYDSTWDRYKKEWVCALKFKNGSISLPLTKDDVAEINNYFSKSVAQKLTQKLYLYDDTKQIDEKKVLLVSGFIRQCANLLLSNNDTNNPYYIIPTDIADVCFNYYFESEYFAIVGENITISGDRNIITKANKDSTWNNTSYGRQRISAKQTNQSIYHWIFRLDGYRGGGLLIGITSNTTKNIINEPFYKINGYCNYGVNIFNGKKVSNDGFLPFIHKRINKGDFVNMVLDMSQGILKYSFLYDLSFDDGTKNQIAWNIKRGDDIEYRIAISIGWKDSSVSIQQFEIC